MRCRGQLSAAVRPRTRPAGFARDSRERESAADSGPSLGSSHQPNIIAGAKSSFLQGDEWACAAGIAAILLGAAIVFLFPKRDEEEALLTGYHAEGSSGR